MDSLFPAAAFNARHARGALPDDEETWLRFPEPISFDRASAILRDVRDRDGVRTDRRVGSAALRFLVEDGVPRLVATDGDSMALRANAFAQLCTKLRVPGRFARELPDDLLADTMNWALTRYGGTLLLRLAGDQVRAVLSDGYAIINDDLLLRHVGAAFVRVGGLERVRVRAVATGLQTVLRFVFPDEGREVRVGDIIEHGLDVENSEVGQRAIRITPITYRLVCTNGARRASGQRQLNLRHIGEPEHLLEHIQAAIPRAIDAASDDLALWERASSRGLKSARRAIDSLTKLGVSRETRDAIYATLMSERGTPGRRRSVSTTVFEFANAITATARDLPAGERLTLEEVGHAYLTAAA